MIQQQRSYEGFVHDLDQVVRPDVLSRIKCPTLIVHSQNDHSVPIEHAVFANQQIKDSSLKTYKNKWGHLIWIGDDSDEPLQDIINFVKQDLSRLS